MTRAPTARRKAADAYHHGDLREGLLTAAREALETTAPEDITLKALAVRLGVSQPAPYRHFVSREALLQAVATDGFHRFRIAMQAAEAQAGGGESFTATSLAYVRFAQQNRGVYRLLFASRLLHGGDAAGPLAEAAAAAFHYLLDSVSTHAPPERARAIAVWIWSTLHGIVMLDAEGLLSGPPDNPLTVEQVVRELGEAIRARL